MENQKPVVTLENYASLAARTEKVPDGNTELNGETVERLTLAFAMALTAGEVLNGLKSQIVYGKPLSEEVLTSLDFMAENMEVEAAATTLTPYQFRLLHAALGGLTERVELMDTVMKHIFKGEALDTVNLIEEGGDDQWFNALMLNVLGVSLQTELQVNIDKLFARYGDKFSVEAAVNRDLTKERQVLEDSMIVLKGSKLVEERKDEASRPLREIIAGRENSPTSDPVGDAVLKKMVEDEDKKFTTGPGYTSESPGFTSTSPS